MNGEADSIKVLDRSKKGIGRANMSHVNNYIIVNDFIITSFTSSFSMKWVLGYKLENLENFKFQKNQNKIEK